MSKTFEELKAKLKTDFGNDAMDLQSYILSCQVTGTDPKRMAVITERLTDLYQGALIHAKDESDLEMYRDMIKAEKKGYTPEYLAHIDLAKSMSDDNANAPKPLVQ